MDPYGNGIAGERVVGGEPGGRDDRRIFETVASYLAEDSLFRHVNDVDERRLP
jgi:NitT/TauT family transport system ATP-binding protein